MTIALDMTGSSAPLARRNPVAKMAAGLAATSALLATVDPLTPAIALAAELAVVPLFGLGYRDLYRRVAPILLTSIGFLLTMMLFTGIRTGTPVLALGPVVVTSDVLVNATALTLRLVAIAIPGVLVFATTDPTDLADALIQNLRIPARFAIGALAAFRLIPLLGEEWRLIGLARRARGIDAGRNPLAHLRLFSSTMFGLLVAAIRRGIRLATAMDARGFDTTSPRTMARPRHFGPADVGLIAAGVLIGSVSLAVSIWLGTFASVLA